MPGKSKITYFDIVSVVVDQYIVWFDITVDDAVVVEVEEDGDELLGDVLAMLVG